MGDTVRETGPAQGTKPPRVRGRGMASRSNCPPYINKSRVCENWKFGSWKPRGGQTLLSCRSPSSGVKEEGEQEPSNKKKKKKDKKTREKNKEREKKEKE